MCLILIRAVAAAHKTENLSMRDRPHVQKTQVQGWSETEINDCGCTPLVIKHVQAVANCIELEFKLAKRLIGLYTREQIWQICGKAEWVVKC